MNSQSPANLVLMSHLVSAAWEAGHFALEPMPPRLNDGLWTVQLIFHWSTFVRHHQDCRAPMGAENLRRDLPSMVRQRGETSINPLIINWRTGHPIQTGDIIEFKGPNLDLFPDYRAVKYQWDCIRTRAFSSWEYLPANLQPTSRPTGACP